MADNKVSLFPEIEESFPEQKDTAPLSQAKHMPAHSEYNICLPQREV